MRYLFLLALILISSQSYAAKIFKISGNSHIAGNYTNQNLSNDTNLVNDSQIYLRTQKILNKNLKFGIITKGEYVLRSNDNNLDPTLDKAFFFSKYKKLGQVEIGNVEAVNQRMKVGGFSLAKGGSGINGKYLENINLNNNFIVLAQSPIGHGGNVGVNNRSITNINNASYRSIKDDSFDGLEDATKLNVISNRINGFKFGVSYTPNAQDQGISNVSNFSYNNNVNLVDIYSAAINYLKNFDNLSLEIAATSEIGDVKYDYNNQNSNDLFAYDVGVVIGYFGFEVGFSYGSWQASLAQDTKNNLCQNCARPNYFTTGISYEIGPFSTSITSINSNYYDNKFSAISFDFNYKLTKDLMTYFEVTKFEFKKSDYGIFTSNDFYNNQGYVAMVGTLINF